MDKSENYNTLLIRMDKIGDLVVSLNAAEHPALKDQRCLWVISKGLGWVLENSPYRKNFMEANKNFSLNGLFQLVRAFRSSGAKNAVIFQAPWFVSLALWLAGVPNRVGRLSQWHSYLFFNKGARQKRSLSEKHESEYNWDLISQGLGKNGENSELAPPQLFPPNSVELTNLPKAEFCVVHPGMMGSALNWPTVHYIQLVKSLSEQLPVVITGTSSDRPWTEPLRQGLGDSTSLYWLQESLSPQQLLVVLSKARFVVAPSTGIIHLASALGTPVVGFYSPRMAERVTRWGPLNKNALVFTPPLDTAEQANCMALIEPEDVFAKISQEWLS